MARLAFLGNGALTVGLNEHGLVHDFYYPYVGLDNLTTARSVHHKIGIWADGAFSWVDDGNWDIHVNFEDDALISDVTMRNSSLQIEIRLQDFVDAQQNVFGRMIKVHNQAPIERDIRLFLHQVFQISRAGRADTAFYEPEEHYIFDYKGRCALLISARGAHGEMFDQFAIGGYGVDGKEGTYRDAEDGELSGSPIEHGGVDSVMRMQWRIAPDESKDADYWIIASDSQQTAETIHDDLKRTGLLPRMNATRTYWQQWLELSAEKRQAVAPELKAALTKSLLMIKVHIDRRGGIIASCDSSIYNYGKDYYSYVWPRDGAYALWPLIRLGYRKEAENFFEFCAGIAHPEGYLMHKYQPDRAIGSTWHPLLHGRRKELAIQEDETASVVYMIGEYYDYIEDRDFVESLYLPFIQPAANFMARFIDEQTGLPHASYDLWEEKFLTSTYTAAVTYAALNVAMRFADMFGYPDDALKWKTARDTIGSNSVAFYNLDDGSFRKGFLLDESTQALKFDNTIDASSWYGVFMYEYPVKKDYVRHATEAIEQKLLNACPSGGVPRYEHDNYFLASSKYIGNPWFVTTLWLAQYYVRVGKTKEASALVIWTLNHMGPSGLLSEQIHPETGAHVGVSPLVWSHAELANTILDLADH